jgi:hypothetical protein
MLAIGNYGRFANALYQCCGVFGIARRNGLAPVFPLLRNEDHRNRFGSNEDVDVYKHFINKLPSIPEGIKFIDKHVQWGYANVALPAANWNISGHFQSFKYFEHCKDEIKWYLKMHGEKQLDYCAIHYRAGDYSKDPQGYHPRMPLAYYRKAIQFFPKNQKYIVFSDDMKEASLLMNELSIDWIPSEGKDYIDDFRQMKCCSHFIIANSSFSALAAWISDYKNKIVISPSGYNWFGDIAGINGSDIVHPTWNQIRFSKTINPAIL